MVKSDRPVYLKHDDNDSLVTYVGYRWYLPIRALPWASQNARNFHTWILRFKQDDYDAKGLFQFLLMKLWLSTFDAPDCLVAVPPARSFDECPDYPIAEIGRRIARSFNLPIGSVGSLKRIVTLPRCVDSPDVRNVSIQAASLVLDSYFRDEFQTYLLVDDITTSGSHLKAAAQLVRERCPSAKILGFAFGKTANRGSIAFPDRPEFPPPGFLSGNDLKKIFYS